MDTNTPDKKWFSLSLKDALLDEGPAINCAWYLWDTEERIQAELERKRNVMPLLPRKGQSHAGVA